MVHQLAVRVLKETGLGAIALLIATIVIVPVLLVINTIYNSGGLYALLIAVAALGIALLFYQARIRPRLP